MPSMIWPGRKSIVTSTGAGMSSHSIWPFLVLICSCIGASSAHASECGNLLDVSGSHICHVLSRRSLAHSCQPMSTTIYLQSGSLSRVIPFSTCDTETDYSIVRALCNITLRPIIETSNHVVWSVDGDSAVTGSPGYLFIFEVNMFELFAFEVGRVVSCINDRYNGRAVLCLIHETSGSGMALHRYVYSNARWSRFERFSGFISSRAPLTSSSFVLEYCGSVQFVIVGTTAGVQARPFDSTNYRELHTLVPLQAVKLLKPSLCRGILYVLTSDGLQLYDVHNTESSTLQPMNWSVAELSPDGSRVAFAGTYPADKSCWVQVRKTEGTTNQAVILNVTHGECYIASIAVSETHVCYHQTNISGNSWKLACMGFNGNGEELVLWEGEQRRIKDWSLLLTGNVLVEREWGTSHYVMKFFHLPRRTAVYRHVSKYSALAYVASGTQGCRFHPTIVPSAAVQAPTTAVTSISNGASSSVEPTSSTGEMPSYAIVQPFPHEIIIGGCFAVTALVVIACWVVVLLVCTIACCVKNQRQNYQTGEGNPKCRLPRVKSESCDTFDV